MILSKILSEIVREGMDANYTPNEALNIYNAAQSKQYNKAIKEKQYSNIIQNTKLDQKAKNITSRYFKIYKPHRIITKHY